MSPRTSEPGGSAEPLVVGVDMATAEVRAEVRDSRGGLAASASAALPHPIHGADGSAEQDARTWWPAVREALARCTAELGDRSRAIAALAVCATSGTVTAVDTDAEPVAPAIMYDDRRGTEPAARARRAGAGRWNDIGITPSATSGLAHLALLAEHTEAPGTRLVHTPDVIAERLVGHPVATDSSHALKSGYDPLREQWVHEALEAAGVAPERLPEVVAPARPLGLVSRKAAAETGLPVGCQVRSGMTDGCAGQLAAGAVENGQVVTVIGTTMVLKAVSAELAHDPTGVVYSHRHPEGGWLPGGASNTGGEALADMAGELAELDRAAEERGPAGMVCYPLRRRGERFPFSDERARGFRSAEPGDRVELHRARLEGVAFCEKLALRRLGALGVTVNGPIRTAGGGARSSTWCRIRASVLGEPVLRVPGAGTPLGAALLAASGTVYPDLSSAAAVMAPRARVVEPVADEVERLAESYETFRAELTARGWLA